MALTYSTVSNGTRADHLVKGTKLKQAVITTSLGAGNATDYSSGFTLTPLKLGMSVIYAVLSASAQNNAGTTLSDKVWWTYDHVNTKLRFFKGSSGVGNMTEEDGTNIDAGAKLRVTVLGV